MRPPVPLRTRRVGPGSRRVDHLGVVEFASLGMGVVTPRCAGVSTSCALIVQEHIDHGHPGATTAFACA